MGGIEHGQALAPLRNRAVEAVTRAFEADLIELEEMERRIALAKTTESDIELHGLIAAATPPHPRMVERVPERSTAVAVFGSSRRSGRWTVPRTLTAGALFGSVELDLREAMVGPVSELRAFAAFGSVEIVAPPDVRIEVDGIGVLGAFESEGASEVDEGPVVRVTGAALFGSVEVTVRRPGESARQARKRQKKQQALTRGRS